jgi:NAD(P)-dependent dehydrogenase (short-subunit alcohol dehydrogenase family)
MNGAPDLLIAAGVLSRRSLKDQIAVITGAGRGIGYEVARAIAWLGGHVVIADIDPGLGRKSASIINTQIAHNSSVFIHTDVGDEDSVNRLAHKVLRIFGRVDIVVNNAVTMPVGTVREQSIRDWDISYRVNLRGSVLMSRIFLPAMIEQESGVIAFVSSAGGKYRGAFETMKSGQVELAHTIHAEYENSGIIAFSIFPGFVHTPGMETVARQISVLLKTDTSINDLIKPEPVYSAEIAGAAIAVAIVYAPRYRGQDVIASQALKQAGIDPDRAFLDPIDEVTHKR